MWRNIINLVKWTLKQITYRSRLEDKVDLALRRLLRLEIIDAIRRNDKTTVHMLYDEYKKLGGNSYIQEMYEEYIKKTKRKKK
jgi:hypothetical protein